MQVTRCWALHIDLIHAHVERVGHGLCMVGSYKTTELWVGSYARVSA